MNVRAGCVCLAIALTAASGDARAQTSAAKPSAEIFHALYGGEPDRALQLADVYLKTHPADVTVLVLAARAHLAREEYRLAYDRLERALAIDPRDVDALYFMGIAAGQLAAREFERVYTLAPESARAHQLMARSLALQGKSAEASAEYERALHANPNLLEALLELGELRREESDCEGAAALYERAQRIKSTYDGAYGLGVCRALLNDHRAAVEQFREALREDPQAAAALFGLGSSLLQLGDTSASVAPLERAVQLEPQMRQAYYLLGRAYRTLGLLERSQEAFARADELARAARSPDGQAGQSRRARRPPGSSGIPK